ncbi:MAG: DUF2240 family protein [Candidatus Lokiarchaeota archaeon]|nr:DUF2240 family protein [Candidatus Lokiarchaeota archaeon]
MKIDDYIRKIIEETGLHKDEIENLVKGKKEELKGLISDEGALFIIAKELGVDVKDQNSDFMEDIEINISDITSNMKNIILVGRIKDISRINTFKKKDGNTGKVGSFLLNDKTGDIRVVLWDDNTEILENDNFKIDELVKLVNGYAKEGKYGIEVHIGNLGKVVLSPNDVDYKKYPKIVSKEDIPINEINLSQRLVSVQGKVMQKSKLNEFEKKDGSLGKVCSIFLTDPTNSIRITFWDDKTDLLQDIETGNVIKITNLNPKQSTLDPNQIELSTSFNSGITKEQKELNIKEEVVKKIKFLQEKNNIVSFKGIISSIDDLRKITLRSGEEVSLLSLILSDDTDGIRVTIWKENAEKYSEILKMGQGVVLKNVLSKYSNFSKRKEISFLKSSELELKDLVIKNLKELDASRIENKKQSYTGNYTCIKDINSTGFYEIKGVIVKELNNITIYEACSKCNKKTSNCTCEEIGDSVNRMILNMIIDDGTNTIRTVFVGKNAEELIKEKTETVSEIINTPDYNTFLEELSKKLIGIDLIIKGKARFSDFSNSYELSVYDFKELNVNEELERMINEIDV